jgi:hypothetical protein
VLGQVKGKDKCKDMGMCGATMRGAKRNVASNVDTGKIAAVNNNIMLSLETPINCNEIIGQ